MSIANPRNPSTFAATMVRALVLALLCLVAQPFSRVCAQGDAPPPKPPPRPEGQNRERDHDRDFDHDRGKSFGPGGPGGPGQRYGGGFPGGGSGDTLSEDEKKQLRVAMEKVWNDAEIVAARERIMKANEELRTALRTALEKKDPAVLKILEKVKNVMPWDQHRGPPRLPRPEDPNFPRMAAARLGMEMMFTAKPEQRDAFRHLHEKVVALPPVKEAIGKIEAAAPENRWEAFKALREVYKKECEREVADYKAKHPDAFKGPEGVRPPAPSEPKEKQP